MSVCVCDGCEGIIGMGRGVGCVAGAACGCECHVWDSRTCAEIVIAHKRAAPRLNVEFTAGMHRNHLFKYLDAHLNADEITRAVEINQESPAGHASAINNVVVPKSIAQLARNVSPVSVVMEGLGGNYYKPKLTATTSAGSKVIDNADNLLSASRRMVNAAAARRPAAARTPIKKPAAGKRPTTPVQKKKKACRQDT